MVDALQEQAITIPQAIEEALSRTIDALMRWDTDVLLQLAEFFEDCDVRQAAFAIDAGVGARLSAKLQLLGRLLHQTQVSLHLMGVGQNAYAAEPLMLNRQYRIAGR